MKKSDLRHGMVVETRDKLRFLVTGDKLEGERRISKTPRLQR